MSRFCILSFEFCIIFIVDKSASWSAKCLMCCRGDNIEIFSWSLYNPPGNKPCNMCYICHEKWSISVFLLYFFCNIIKFFPVNCSWIRRKSCDDKSWFVCKSFFFDLFIVDAIVFFANTIGNSMKHDSRDT